MTGKEEYCKYLTARLRKKKEKVVFVCFVFNILTTGDLFPPFRPYIFFSQFQFQFSTFSKIPEGVILGP